MARFLSRCEPADCTIRLTKAPPDVSKRHGSPSAMCSPVITTARSCSAVFRVPAAHELRSMAAKISLPIFRERSPDAVKG
jgi:hypothetical protein